MKRNGARGAEDRWESTNVFQVWVNRARMSFRGTLIAGIALLVPVVVTFIVLQIIFQWIDGLAQPLVKRIFSDQRRCLRAGAGPDAYPDLACRLAGRQCIRQTPHWQGRRSYKAASGNRQHLRSGKTVHGIGRLTGRRQGFQPGCTRRISIRRALDSGFCNGRYSDGRRGPDRSLRVYSDLAKSGHRLVGCVSTRKGAKRLAHGGRGDADDRLGRGRDSGCAENRACGRAGRRPYEPALRCRTVRLASMRKNSNAATR